MHLREDVDFDVEWGLAKRPTEAGQDKKLVARTKHHRGSSSSRRKKSGKEINYQVVRQGSLLAEAPVAISRARRAIIGALATSI